MSDARSFDEVRVFCMLCSHEARGLEVINDHIREVHPER